MTPLVHIRKQVLKLSQRALADLVGTSQATVSRWERGELSPSLEEMARIRQEAKRLNLEWDDAWFFSPPAFAATEAA